MRHIPNEVVWAVIASLVCGVVIVSLLAGTNMPWLVVAVLLGLGFAATTVRRRRERARYARYRDEHLAGVETSAPATLANRRRVASDPRVTGAVGPSPGETRRAGARSASLGAKQPGDQDPSR